ncbi:MAG: UDP-3-O-(3-hydroxymyristoyl)glucosamine N-acyltransferase [Epsilonproteobacteria bacterium]|nr:UDP-3-O-(3-hydroxymyristoyl)glucosamine N-acyltransferase [Campylobacterota bacterium]
MKLSKIAQILGLTFSGEDKEINSMNTLSDATKDEITFISNPKYAKEIPNTQAGAILITETAKDLVPSHCEALIVEDPYWCVALLSKEFAPPIEDNDGEVFIGEGTKIDPKATIAKGAKIGTNCTIMAGVYIGSKCEIGDNTILYPNVVVYRDCKIGSNCIIHANTTIGGDGFGFATNKMGEHKKIYQNGNVVIENDVEIGNSVAIDRAVFSSTLIKKGVHIDNLVQIGHNCEVGEFSVMVSQSGLAGSTKLGRNVVMGGQAAAAGHLEIAPFNQFAARSGITKTIKEQGKTWAGFPLYEHKQWLKLQSKIAKLLKS